MLYKDSHRHTLITYPLNNAYLSFIPLNEYCIVLGMTDVYWLFNLRAVTHGPTSSYHNVGRHFDIILWTDIVSQR